MYNNIIDLRAGMFIYTVVARIQTIFGCLYVVEREMLTIGTSGFAKDNKYLYSMIQSLRDEKFWQAL